MANIFTTLFGSIASAVSRQKSSSPDLTDGSAINSSIGTYNVYQDSSIIRSLGSDVYSIIDELHRYDPDAANALWAMLRFAETPLSIIYRDEKGEFDADKTREFNTTLKAKWLFSVREPSPQELSSMIIRELFLHGGVGMEIVLDKFKLPLNYVFIHTKDINWRWKNSSFMPYQIKTGGGEVNLDIPTFFFQTLDRAISQSVGESPLLTAIQAIEFKRQVIIDIQRVVKRVGYPRIKVTVLEDVMRKHAPADMKSDPKKLATWLKEQKTNLATDLKSIKPEDAIVLYDSVDMEYLKNNVTASLDFRPLIEILDSQVVSALKSLPSILGKTKGSSQNTASMEAMVYLNTPTFLQRRAEKLLSQVFTMTARLMGYKGFIEAKHQAINLRPELELEPQKLAKQSRILQLQSFGHITDSEAALMLDIDHLPTEELSGTLFLTGRPSVDTENISPNTDPTGRSITGGDGAGDTIGQENSN